MKQFFYCFLFFFVIWLDNITICMSAPSAKDSANQIVNKIDQSIQNNKIQSSDNKSIKKSSVSLSEANSEIYYEYCIEQLNNTSPIKLEYNADVKIYIEKYTRIRKDDMAKIMGLSKIYFPIFEEYLDKYNLPLELKYLSIAESGLNSTAVSSSGAKGLWQLMLNSAKLLGLDVNSYVDERFDVYKSTDAACRYLKYLFGVFNDWQLALAAYNGGPGEVRNAILRSGGKTSFWDIQPYLPEQTRNYVPSFIAAVYAANHAADHGIIAQEPRFTYLDIDTLLISEAAEFSKISEKTGLDLDALRFLNPKYIRDYIPDTEKPEVLILPTDKISAFLRNENQIYSRKNELPDYIENLTNAGETEGRTRQYYTVKQGDYLHKIALNYGVTSENILAWNNLKSNSLNAGQILAIWVKNSNNPPVSYNVESKKDTTVVFYTVRKGDTMWSIAEKFNYDSVAQLKSLNSITDDKQLKPGQKLRIVKVRN